MASLFYYVAYCVQIPMDFHTAVFPSKSGHRNENELYCFAHKAFCGEGTRKLSIQLNLSRPANRQWFRALPFDQFCSTLLTRGSRYKFPFSVYSRDVGNSFFHKCRNRDVFLLHRLLELVTFTTLYFGDLLVTLMLV